MPDAIIPYFQVPSVFSEKTLTQVGITFPRTGAIGKQSSLSLTETRVQTAINICQAVEGPSQAWKQGKESRNHSSGLGHAGFE